MADEKAQAPFETKAQSWTAKQVYILGTIALVVGLAFGYLLRGSGSAPPPTAQAGDDVSEAQQMDAMQRSAEKTLAQLQAQLKADPKNAQILIKIGTTYKQAHQFKQAADYFQQALALDPTNVRLSNEIGEDLYYAGDADQAIVVLEQGLKTAPNDPGMLIDLGLVKFRSKNDVKGAVVLWQRLLDNNASLPADKKQRIEKLIADAKAGRKV